MTRTELNNPPICIVGAAPDTSNLGVSALFASIVHGLKTRMPDVPLVVFDNGLGVRKKRHRVSVNLDVEVEHRGMRMGQRVDRSENLYNLSWLSNLGALGTALNANLRCLANARAILDISGGDSFSDIYGAQRFWSVVLPKQLALRLQVPLILLPQTYGPYRADKLKAQASRAIAGARAAWARDARSYDILRELLGDNYCDRKHRLGVDMAFALEPVPIPRELPNELRQMLADKQRPLVGLNISGLIFNDPAASGQYGFRANYQALIAGFVDRLLTETDANLMLVPHVLSSYEGESDNLACQRIYNSVSNELQSRVTIAPIHVDQCEVKWLIGHCDWFCGTRMHATIASLSQGIPTATVNYSDKARGVFESCQQGSEVYDPRQLDTAQVVEHLMDSVRRRESIGSGLATALPGVRRQASAQMDEIVATIASSQPGSRG